MSPKHKYSVQGWVNGAGPWPHRAAGQQGLGSQMSGRITDQTFTNSES